MRKLQDTKPIGHALIWIAIYIVAVNIGDFFGEKLGFPGFTSIVLIALYSPAHCDPRSSTSPSLRSLFCSMPRDSHPILTCKSSCLRFS